MSTAKPRISVEKLADEVPEAAVSATYQFQPHGLQFNFPVELRLPIERVPAHAILVTESGSQIERIEAALGEVDGEAVATGPIEHFSKYTAERATSACYWIFDGVPDPGCSIQNSDKYVKWMIDDTYGRSDRQLTTMIHFKNRTSDLVIVDYFTVDSGTNVSTRDYGERVEDHTKPRLNDTGGIRVLTPTPASTSAAYWEAVKMSRDPMKGWWRSADLRRYVAPEDDLKPMSYNFCLTYRIADDPDPPDMPRKICGTYAGTASRICPLGACIEDAQCGADHFCGNGCCQPCAMDPDSTRCKSSAAGTGGTGGTGGESGSSSNAPTCTAWGSANECATSITVTRRDAPDCTQAVVLEGTNSCSYDARFMACIEGRESDTATDLSWSCYLLVSSDGDPVPANASFVVQGVPHACMGTGAYKLWAIPASELEANDCRALSPKGDGSNAFCSTLTKQCQDVTPVEP